MFDARVRNDGLGPFGFPLWLAGRGRALSRAPARLLRALLCLTTGLLTFQVTGCRSEEPELGSQTNWLLDCQTSAECGGLECICGICTLDCSAGEACGSLSGASCVSAESDGAIALCGGQAPTRDFCGVTCEDGACPAGASCLAGVCSPDSAATATLTINPQIRFQPLIGFGAGLSVPDDGGVSSEETILSHPNKNALLAAMFEESGFSMLRLENRFQGAATDDLAPTQEIIAEATSSLGKPPTVFLYANTPPANLKANGTRRCANSDPACTLGQSAAGGFDYEGFADYWRASLVAYEDAGITPRYVSIQSNADWLPGSAEAEACRLLPQEGLSSVTLESGETTEALFAGYSEALSAVKAALDPSMLITFAAPEVGSSPMVSRYTDVLDASEYGALAFHLYGEVALGGNREHLARIGQIGSESGRPAIQSEMDDTGLNTAVLAHHTLVTAGGAAYLQRNFITELTTENAAEEPRALIGVAEDSFELLPPYHALAHFARHTEAGWLRVDAALGESDLLASAWIAPDDSALTIVIINPTPVPANVEVQLPAGWEDSWATASVTRTVFDGVERSSALGALGAAQDVELPGNSIVTIAGKTP